MKRIVKYSLEQIRELIARGEDGTDFAAVARKTEPELESDIASDPVRILANRPRFGCSSLPDTMFGWSRSAPREFRSKTSPRSDDGLRRDRL